MQMSVVIPEHIEKTDTFTCAKKVIANGLHDFRTDERIS
jgi:hypothetical protein